MKTKSNQIGEYGDVNPSQVDPLLTVHEAAEMLSASVPTFWRWVAQRRVPGPIKLGGLSRWPRSEILDVIETAKAARNVP